MTTRAQKIRVGAFAVIAAVLLGIVLVVFGGMRFWVKHDRYRVEMSETVYGLEKGAKVYLDGVHVGSVVDIEIAHDDLRKVYATIEIDDDTPVRTDTVAMLQLAGITGLKEIDLRRGTLSAPALPEGGTIKQGETTLDLLEHRAKAIADRSGELMDRAEKLVDNLVELSNPDDYRLMIADARTTAKNLAEASAALETLVKQNGVTLSKSIAAIHDTAQSVSAMLDGQISQLVATANDTVSDLHSVLRDNQGSLRAAVSDLRQASRTFKDLAREVKDKPSRLLYGKPSGDRKLP